MKKLNGLFFLVIAIGLMSFMTTAWHTDVYKVDTSLSVLEWFATKVTGKHNGIIKLSGGVVTDNHGKLGGSFEFDMTTIECSDLEAGSKSKQRLEDHLKSADFFDATNFPKAKFVITSAQAFAEAKPDGSTHAINGLLTIKDKTNQISFDAAIVAEGEKLFCSGTAVVDRSKFDIRYGSKTFFADIGDKMIHDEFTLKFNVVAAYKLPE